MPQPPFETASAAIDESLKLTVKTRLPIKKPMKTRVESLIGLVLTVGIAGCISQLRAAEDPSVVEARVLNMRSVPDGHFLASLQLEGRERLLNIRVKDNTARCVNSSDPRLKGLQGRFELVGNGVFVIFFRNENHRATQYWLFRQDGSAAVKEVPDRGEKQKAVPVKDDSLEAPNENRW
jgi:hypothetical protein